MLTVEQIAHAIAGLDSQALGRLTRLLPPATARSLIGAAARLHPPRPRIDDFERVLGAVREAGETGVTMAQITRKLRMPAASIRRELGELINRAVISDEPDDHCGRGRPAVRFRLIP